MLENDCFDRPGRVTRGRVIEIRIAHDLRAGLTKSLARNGFHCRFDGISFDLTADVRLLG